MRKFVVLFCFLCVNIQLYSQLDTVTKPISKDIKISTDSLNNQPIYIKVDQSASFQEGDLETFRNWIATQLIYPEEALTNNQEGLIVVQFVVDAQGTVWVMSLLKSTGFQSLDNEAIRVIKSSPVWNPAKVANIPVNQMFTLPIVFQISKNDKRKKKN